MDNRNYTCPVIDSEWAAVRETSMVIATAIHAIAGDERTPDEIWTDPTPDETDNVMMAAEEYLIAGDFPREDDGEYCWGEAIVHIEAS